jgi:error-prone DNA polymerase
MVYQEDVIKVTMALGGFSVEDGDQLRKVLSKKHKQRRLDDYHQQFVVGATVRGVTRPIIDQIWAMIMSFAGYSFCKPHSASYAQVSYKSVYLRAHYPAEFMAAVLSNQGGFYSPYAYLSETRRMGLTILPPDINASEWHYTGSGQTLRVGLMQIKGLHKATVERLCADRAAHGPFRSLSDYLDRRRPDPSQTRLLIKAGGFDSLAGDLTRPALLWRMFAWHADASSTYTPVPPDYTEGQKIQHERQLFGFPLRCHPLEQHWHRLLHTACIPACALAQHVGRTVTLAGVVLTEKVVQTKQGEPMEFVTLEDSTAVFDATFFPKIYRTVGHLLTPNHCYLVTGKVEEQFSACTLTVTALQLLHLPQTNAHSPFDEEEDAWSVPAQHSSDEDQAC